MAVEHRWGCSSRELADALGLTERAVAYIEKRLGIVRRKKRLFRSRMFKSDWTQQQALLVMMYVFERRGDRAVGKLGDALITRR